jgi:hypothetical protein
MTALQFGIALLVNSANDSNFRSFLVDQANHVRHFHDGFPWNEAPRYMIRDRDRIYGPVVTRRRLRTMGIRDNGNRRDADVLVCAKLRRYYKFKGPADESHVDGICFFLPDGTRIENFPERHSDNCTTKHQVTKSWFKPTVRTFKNLRNSMIEAKIIEDGLAPS